MRTASRHRPQKKTRIVYTALDLSLGRTYIQDMNDATTTETLPTLTAAEIEAMRQAAEDDLMAVYFDDPQFIRTECD